MGQLGRSRIIWDLKIEREALQSGYRDAVRARHASDDPARGELHNDVRVMDATDRVSARYLSTAFPPHAQANTALPRTTPRTSPRTSSLLFVTIRYPIRSVSFVHLRRAVPAQRRASRGCVAEAAIPLQPT